MTESFERLLVERGYDSGILSTSETKGSMESLLPYPADEAAISSFEHALWELAQSRSCFVIENGFVGLGPWSLHCEIAGAGFLFAMIPTRDFIERLPFSVIEKQQGPSGRREVQPRINSHVLSFGRSLCSLCDEG